jgi:hypothetical protein
MVLAAGGYADAAARLWGASDGLLASVGGSLVPTLCSVHLIQGVMGCAANDWEAIKASTAVLNQACQNCHAVYRERVDDGTFRIKRGSS